MSKLTLPDSMSVYLAAIFILSPGFSGLCLLEEHVLLLSPCEGKYTEAGIVNETGLAWAL